VHRVITLTTSVSLLALVTLATSCGSSAGSKSPVATRASSTVRSSGGFSIGEIKRLPGGTAVPNDARTLMSATCTDGRLVVQTDRESVVGQMDCSQMIPAQVVDRFRGKPVAISYNNQRLHIESASEGTVELTVTNAAIGAGDVSP
jgi:hypothetical protein